jgi:soluble cytochrome b562
VDGAGESRAFADLERFALRVRRRLRRHALLSAGAVGLIALGAIASVATATVLFVGPLLGVRIAALVAAALVVLATLGFAAHRGLRRHRALVDVARYVEARVPGLRSGLTSALELRPRYGDLRAEGRTSVTLLDALAERTAERLAPVDLRRLVPARRVAVLGGVLALLVVAIGVAGALHGEVLGGGVRALLAGAEPIVAGPPPPARVAVPVLASDLTVTYRYPDYTGLPDRRDTNVSGDLRGLPGTRVRLATRALVPARSAELVLDSAPDAPLELAVGLDGSLGGELVLERPDAWRLRVRKPDGSTLVEESPRTISIDPDEPPRIRLLVPETDLEVNRDDRIELLFDAQDDFGVENVTLAYQREGAGALPVRRVIGGEPRLPDGHGGATFDLKPLELRPGEGVTVWLEATDNDRVSGPKTARSEQRVVRIWSPTERHEKLLAAERELFERFLLLLADRLVLPPEPLPAARAERVLEALTAIVNGTDAGLDVLEGLLREMRADPLTPEDVLRDFAEIHSRLTVLLEHETKLLRRTLRLEGERRHAPDRQLVLARHNAETTTELERSVLLMDRLIDRQHQERVLGEGRELTRQADSLLRMLAELERGGDDALKLQMARELDRMQQNIEQMMKDLYQQAKEVPYDRFNPAALGDRGTASELRSYRGEIEAIKKLLQEGRLAEARERLEALARSSQQMVAELEGDFAERGSERWARTSRQVDRVRRRLDHIVRYQTELHDTTADAEERYRRRVQRRLQDRLDNPAEREAGRIARLERRLKATPREALHEDDRKELDQHLGELQDIRRLLQEGDVGTASKLADRLERGVQALRREVEQGAMLSSEPEAQAGLRQAERRLRQAEPAARDLAESLRKLLPDPQEMLSRKEQREMQRLGGRQDRLRGRLDQARRSMGQLGAEQPGLQGQLERLMDEAEQSMEQAGRELSQLNPSLAEEHQRSALEKLGQAGEQLDRAARPQQPGQREGVGVGDHRKRVEIPQAADYRVPAEFREELLKAMKEEAPPLYRELVERYYESLIR